jgi:predicted RNA-binding protein associated with RNAse of E/G family
VILEEGLAAATGKFVYVRPATVIEDTESYLALYYPLGYTFASSDYIGRPRPEGMSARDYVPRRYAIPLAERVEEFLSYAPSTFRVVTNTRWHVVYLEPHEAMHAYWLFWDSEWTLLTWYVNLQASYVRTERGIQVTDYALDLAVTPDLAWLWKDEDEFEAMCERGIFSPAMRDAIRAEGRRAIEAIEKREWPFDAGWPDWRPPADWPLPQIRDYWEEKTYPYRLANADLTN